MRPKGGIQLSGDYFVADSLLRSHAFQLSDFATTFYLAADNSKDALSWMFKFRAVLLVLGGEGEDRVSLVISTRPAAASGAGGSLLMLVDNHSRPSYRPSPLVAHDA